MKQVRARGLADLQHRSSPGAPRRLPAEQLALWHEVLPHGAEADGFRGHVWTRARVAVVIHLECGVWSHPVHISRLLNTHQWCLRQPERRARQRDEAAMARWRQDTGPAINRGAGLAAGHLVHRPVGVLSSAERRTHLRASGPHAHFAAVVEPRSSLRPGCGVDLPHLRRDLRAAVTRVRRTWRVIEGFFRGAKLEFFMHGSVTSLLIRRSALLFKRSFSAESLEGRSLSSSTPTTFTAWRIATIRILNSSLRKILSRSIEISFAS